MLNDGSIPSQILSIPTLQLNKAITIQLIYHRNPHLTILPCHSISFETILQDCKDKNLPWEDFHNIHNLFQAHIQKVTMGSMDPKTAISETGTLQVLLRKIKNKNNIPSHLLDAQNLLSAAIPYSLSLFTPEKSPHTQKLLTTLHPYIASTCIHTYLTSCTNQPPSPNSLLQILTHEHAFIHVHPFHTLKTEPLQHLISLNKSHHVHTFTLLTQEASNLFVTKELNLLFNSHKQQSSDIITINTIEQIFQNAETTQLTWAQSDHFQHFVLDLNLKIDHPLDYFPGWEVWMQGMLLLPNNTVGKNAALHGNNREAFMYFITKIESMFPKGYFDWRSHPLLCTCSTIKKKAAKMFTIILNTAQECKIDYPLLLHKYKIIPQFLSWPTNEKSIWIHVHNCFEKLHMDKYKVPNTFPAIMTHIAKSIRPFIWRKVYQTIYLNTKSIPSPYSIPTMPHFPISPSSISFPSHYMCKHCSVSLISLHSLHTKMCPDCKILACSLCTQLQTEPFNKYCTDCTHIITCLDMPESS